MVLMVTGSGWEDHHQIWFDEAVGRLLHDVHTTSDLDPFLAVDLTDPEGNLYQFAPEGSGLLVTHGAGLARPATSADAVALVADPFVDDVVEELWMEWPPCQADHGHPACLRVVETEAWWACPNSERLLAIVGQLVPSLELVARTFWDGYRLRHQTNPRSAFAADRRFWAWEAVNAVTYGGHPEYEFSAEPLPLLLALADAAPADDAALDYLGAGPIEDYLCHSENQPDIDAVVAAARKHRKFRTALGAAWYRSTLTDEDTSRLQAFGVSPREGPGPAKT
jgi:hypothetical protein